MGIKNNILKFLLVFILAGILGGMLFGFIFGLCVLALIYQPILVFVFSFVFSLFFIPSVWKAIKQKTYFVIIRKFFVAFFFGLLFTVMFMLEEDSLSFNNFDWIVICICVFLVFIPFTTYLILEEYCPQSRIYEEIQHIIKGMQFYGLLPKNDEEK